MFARGVRNRRPRRNFKSVNAKKPQCRGRRRGGGTRRRRADHAVPTTTCPGRRCLRSRTRSDRELNSQHARQDRAPDGLNDARGALLGRAMPGRGDGVPARHWLASTTTRRPVARKHLPPRLVAGSGTMAQCRQITALSQGTARSTIIGGRSTATGTSRVDGFALRSSVPSTAWSPTLR
jgi:hypothetical protein